MTVRTIHFHGALAKQFGARHQFAADTLFLTCQGLKLQLGDTFEEAIRAGKWVICFGAPKKDKSNAIEPEQVNQKLGKVKDIHIFPAVEGKSNVARIVIGAVLMVAGFFVSLIPGWQMVGYAMMSAGAGMAFGGIAGMLAKKPSLNQNQNNSSNPNYFFNGAVNTNEQGVPVPLVYGRVQRAGSVVISQGINVGQLK